MTCLEAPERHRPVIGKATASGVVLSDRYRDDLMAVYKKNYGSETCRNCLAFRFCGGGCPLNVIRDEDSDIYGSSWICGQTKRYWERMLKRLFTEETASGWTVRAIAMEDGIRVVKIG